MQRFELAVEVGPIEESTVERLKVAGYEVYQGNRSWRVVATAPVEGDEPVRVQAKFLALSIVKQFDLETLSNPPAIALRDPDGVIDAKGTQLVLDEVRRSYDPDPKPRPKRKWYQRQMELGLGERKDN